MKTEDASTNSNVPKQKRSRLTRKRLVRSATRLFSEKGYEATSVAQITKRAGVSVGTFYKYFRDKREIFLEIFRDHSLAGAQAMVAELEPLKWKGADMGMAIRSLVRIAYNIHKVDPGLQNAFTQIALKDPEFQNVRKQISLLTRRPLERLLEERRDELTARNIPVAAFLIDAAIDSCIHQSVFFDTQFDEQELIEELARMVSRYLIRSDD